jgi:hypothetical protein
MNTTTETPTFESFGIASSSLLVELSISCWTARKLDKKVSLEVDASKNTKVKAGNYHKHLLAGSPALDAVTKYAAQARLWNNLNSLPWSDNGQRIVTAAQFFGGYKAQLDQHKENFEELTANFLQHYPSLISAAAFQLGDLFDRDEYPMVEEIAHKFRFSYAVSPVPTAGDFRVDIGEQAKVELAKQYTEHFNSRLNHAMQDIWKRLHECLLHMSDRLTDGQDGQRTRFHATLLSNAEELVTLLGRLNIANDPDLEAARVQLNKAISGIDIDDLKEVPAVRDEVKQKVDSILAKFDW